MASSPTNKSDSMPLTSAVQIRASLPLTDKPPPEIAFHPGILIDLETKKVLLEELWRRAKVYTRPPSKVGWGELTSAEAKYFARLLLAAARVLDHLEDPPPASPSSPAAPDSPA